MACTPGNKCAKNCCKQTILVQFIVENSHTFFETQCISQTPASGSMDGVEDVVMFLYKSHESV